MLQSFKKIIQKIFRPRDYSSELEHYIVSKHPKTPCDVEHWTREYEKRLMHGGW